MNVLLAVAEKTCEHGFTDLAPAAQVAAIVMVGILAIVVFISWLA